MLLRRFDPPLAPSLAVDTERWTALLRVLASLLLLASAVAPLLLSAEPWYEVHDRLFPPDTPPQNEVWDVAPLVGIALIAGATAAASAVLLSAALLVFPRCGAGRAWSLSLWTLTATALFGGVGMVLDLVLWSPPTSVGLPKDVPALSVALTERGWVSLLALFLTAAIAGLVAGLGTASAPES